MDHVPADTPLRANDWPESTARAMAQPLGALMGMLRLDTVVINGTASPEHLDRFIRILSASLLPKSDFTAQRKDIRRGRLGENAALIGAAAIALHHRYAPRTELLTELNLY